MLKLLRRVAFAFAWAGAAVALAVALTTVGRVTLRAMTTRPIQGDFEITQFGIALAISMMLPWCQLRGANIIVDFFTQHLRASRLRVLDGIGCVLIAAMYLLLAWRTGVGAQSVYQAGETSMIRSWPMWWVYVSLAPGLALAALVALVQAALHFLQRPMAALVGASDAAS
jgi:TRAP-type C4-dicarboxylate transport system permease small subunit